MGFEGQKEGFAPLPVSGGVGGLGKLKIGGFEGTGSGTQQITGVGFKPKLVIFFAVDMNSPPKGHSWGFDDGSSHRCTWVAGDLSYVDGDDAVSIYIHRDVSNYRRGEISSMDSDGFTITWYLTGDVTARVQYLALE